MGKNKPRKARPSEVGDGLVHSTHPPHCSCNQESPKAADGHNVEGWTDEDIRIYNELLTERAKLEKEKNELEQKSARHQAERALLNEDAAAFDSLFKAQLGGEYKFTGKTSCCLDVSSDVPTAGKSTASKSVCHHEICTRAKQQGVSWMEMDTIKYYQARITAEKSQRMKNALRKQRDVELARVKKDDEEENALRLRRSALQERSSSGGKEDLPSPNFSEGNELSSTGKNALLDPKENTILEAAKENEMVVKRIRMRLDKIRHDVSAGRVTAQDARAKLDQANKEMAEAEKKNNAFKEMVFTAGSGQDLMHSNSTNLSRALSRSLASSSSDAFSQALSVMKGFFSASDPRDVQAAITDLRSVLEVNGPMSPVLQKSFQALEDMLAKPNAKGFSVDLTNKDGTKRTCTNVVEVLLMLRNSEDPTTLDATAEELKLDKATLQANQECIAIEDGAKREMREILKDFNRPEDESMVRRKQLLEKLQDIKDDAAMKSPIPPLSDIVLEEDMNILFYSGPASELIKQVREGGSERDVAGKLTSMVIAFSERDPEKYMKTLQHVSEALTTMRGDFEQEAMVRRALETVKGSMGKFVEKHREKATVKLGDDKVVKDTTNKISVSTSPELPDSLVPGPLQPKKQPKSTKSRSESFSPIPGLDASHLANLDMSGMMKVVQNMQQQLKGLTPDDLVNMLCAPAAGQSDARATNVLKGDLQKFLNLPTGLEDPKLLSRIQQQIAHLASHDNTHIRGSKQQPKLQDSKTKATRESKFQEDLSTSTSPPPYTANEGRARASVKVKHVPVNTPQISDAPSTFSVSDRDRIISAARDFQAKTLEQKAHEMSNDLHKMRKDLLELTNLPGLSGNLAKKVRRQLDNLRRDMEKMEITDPFEEIKDGASVRDNDLTTDTISSAPTIISRSVPPKSSTEPAAQKSSTQRRVRGLLGTLEPSPSISQSSTIQRPPETSSLLSSSPTPGSTLSERELTIQRQLDTLATCLNKLVDTPGPAEDQYGFKEAFKGIVDKLEEQMIGHVEMARSVADVNGWKRLEEWLEAAF